MRFALAVLTLLLVADLRAVAKNLADWTDVQKLKPGTEVRVVDKFGNTVEGYVTSVSRDELKANVWMTNQPGLTSPQVFARNDVREIYKLGKKFERRLSGRNLFLSSTIGALGGIAIGAAVDQAHPSSEDPGQGKLIGGVLGFFVGPAALAIGRAAISALDRTKLIYRAPAAQTQVSPEPRSALHFLNHLDSSIQIFPVDSPYS